MTNLSGFYISRIDQMLRQVLDHLIAREGPGGFSAAQGRILALLWEEDGLFIQALADRSGLAQNTMTSMVDRLADKGLCERRPDPADRRKSRVYLTAEGRALRPAYERVTEDISGIFYKGFTTEEKQQLAAFHARIVGNLEEALQDGK